MPSAASHPWAPGRTSCSSEVLRERSGQSTVEAALLLPTVCVVLALLLQPACLFYTRTVMQHAACLAARAALTTSEGEDAVREMALRRLAAVPEIAPFHVGGRQGWQVEVEGMGTGRVSVSVRGHARPLPLVGAALALASGSDAEGVVLEVSVTEELRPEWLEGRYDDWVSMWG